jgi:hypothetical protein
MDAPVHPGNGLHFPLNRLPTGGRFRSHTGDFQGGAMTIRCHI